MFLLLGNLFLGVARRFFRSKSREFAPETHKNKDSMPTMGGVFILAIVIINSLLWTDYTNSYVWIFLFCISSFGAIGMYDDWQKIRRHAGISAKTKFLLQLTCAGASIALLVYFTPFSTQIVLPFFKYWQPDIGLFFIPWATFILIGCSNAVNLTDGLDGLAIGSLLPNFALFSALCYLAGHAGIAHYLAIPFSGTSEITIIGSILLGTSLGFLWYNTYPAQIFMGDVGSLSLGAALAMMALMAKQELLLAISGGLFVMETVSVIAQVASVRYRKKRIFKMAPIHHHFELLGWPESTITARFGIISLLLCLLALVTVKIR
jgi:phospho-N-acetylmuramoyl-pentapeptide-transferase